MFQELNKFFILRHKIRLFGLAIGIWLAGTVLSALIAVGVDQRLQVGANEQFQRVTECVSREVSRLLLLPLHILSGTRSYYLSTPHITRKAFTDFVLSNDLTVEFAGIRSVGFIERVPGATLNAWLQRERRDDAPTFQVRRLGVSKSDTLYIVKFIEPAINNPGALGVDASSEERRRSALEQAIDTGMPVMTAPLNLVQDQRHSVGAVVYLPVYQPTTHLNSVTERRAALRGVLYSPVVLSELLASVETMTPEFYGLSLQDNRVAAGQNNLLFENQVPTGRQFHSTHVLNVFGRHLTLVITSSTSLNEALANRLALLVGLGGALTSTLLAAVLWLQANKRQRAETLAQSMTQDLNRLALVARNTSNAVIITDIMRRITWVNPGFENISGYRANEVVGKSPNLLQCEATDPLTVAQMREALNAGKSFQGELLNRHKNGHEYWLNIDIQPIRDPAGQLSGFMAVESDITERKHQQNQLEALLRDNNALMSTLDLFGIVSTTDRQGRLTSVNEAFCDISGYTHEELVGQNHRIMNSGYHPASFWRDMWTKIASGAPWRAEVCNRSKDGRLYWVDTFVASFFGDDGQVAQYVAIRIDITARKQAEHTLHWNQSLLQMMSNSSPLGFLVVDNRSDRILYFNPRFCEIWGIEHLSARMSSGQMKHRDILPDCCPILEDLAAYTASCLPLQDEKNRITLEDEIAFTDNRTVRRFSTQIRDANDHYFGRFYLFEDITERRKMEALAQRNADLLRGSIDALDDAFALYDDQDRLVICNQRYRDIYPLCTDVILPDHTFESVLRAGIVRGQFCMEACGPELWIAERMALHRQPFSQFNQKLNDGRTLRIVERRMPNGYTVGFRVDITDLVTATEAAQEASRSKSQFLANMSHEIRTPMNAVLGMLTLLRKTQLTPQQADYASKSENAAQSLLSLLNDILDLSKAEAGKMTIDPQPFGLTQLVTDLKVIVDAYIDSRQVHFSVAIEPGLPDHVTGDALRLKQVLINLCGNAVKFTPEGQVTLTLRGADRHAGKVLLEFVVQDNGIGIAVENQERIFSGFTQAESSTTRRYGGTGLGLAISQRLITLMGGRLELSSELGHGSRFYFTLPLGIVAASEQVTTDMVPISQEQEGAQLAGMRILVAEDNLVNQQIASELLQAEGAVVTLTNDGQEALDAIANADTPFDVVLMDMQMPIMDGLTATRRIREHLDATTLPIVAMTANAMDADREACLEAGMNDHVGKPFNINSLIQVLHKVTRGLFH